MDWGTIIISVVGAVVGGGGLAGVFVPLLNRKEKKRSLQIENVAKTNEEWKKIAEDREQRAAELKADLDRKDGKIDSLYEDMNELRRQLDEANTARAVSELLLCKKIDCGTRRPPLGSGANVHCEVKTKNKQKLIENYENLEAGD